MSPLNRVIHFSLLCKELALLMNTQYRCGTLALLGPTNAGKSSLLNALLQEKISIVTPKVNTTRSQITGIYTDDTVQMIFLDTPGFQTHNGILQKAMTQSIEQSKLSADVLILVLDIHLYIQRPTFLNNDLPYIREYLEHDTRPLVVVLNKVDAFSDKTKLLPFMEDLHEMFPRAEIVPCSTFDSLSVATLRDILTKLLPCQEALFAKDQTSTQSIRFITQELIREQLFIYLQQEVPYVTAVEIIQWEEDEKKAVIHATILVDRESQKAIVIGKGGKTIKMIGSDARNNITALLGKRVYLDLWVKVQPEWYDDVNMLQELGLYGTY